MSSENKKLSDATITDVVVRERFAGWLRAQWPTSTAKHAAREFRASLPTAKGWTRGQLPSNRHWLRMVARWQGPFLAHVYSPICGPLAQLRADQELRDLRERLDRLAAEIAQDGETD